MDPDRKVELIPIEDRKREQIAAQHWLRRSTLAVISEASPEEPKELPVYLSTPEAVGLIGFGWIRVLDVTGASPYERQYPIVHRMRLVLARVHWWIAQKREKASQGICPIAALRPDDRAEVRWAVRKHGTINVQTLLAATDAFASAMDQAIGYLALRSLQSVWSHGVGEEITEKANFAGYTSVFRRSFLQIGTPHCSGMAGPRVTQRPQCRSGQTGVARIGGTSGSSDTS